MGKLSQILFALHLIALSIGNLASSLIPTPSRPPLKITASRSMNVEALAVVTQRCSALNGKLLEICCSTPMNDYFTKLQKTTCNSGKMDAVLFKSTNEYVLNKYQNILNKLDWTIGIGGKTACLAECLFQNSNLIAAGAIDGDAVTAYLAQNLGKAWAAIITTAATNCIDSVATLTATTSKIEVIVRARVTKVCTLAPVLILQCVIKEVGLTCPPDAKSTLPACRNIRTKLTICDPFNSGSNSSAVK